VWSGESEADTYITMHAVELYEQGCPYVFVATNDRELQMLGSSNNMYIISGRRLLNEMREANKELVQELAAQQRERREHSLSSHLPPETLATLEALRQGGVIQEPEVQGSKLSDFKMKFRSKYR